MGAEALSDLLLQFDELNKLHARISRIHGDLSTVREKKKEEDLSTMGVLLLKQEEQRLLAQLKETEESIMLANNALPEGSRPGRSHISEPEFKKVRAST